MWDNKGADSDSDSDGNILHEQNIFLIEPSFHHLFKSLTGRNRFFHTNTHFIIKMQNSVRIQSSPSWTDWK